MKQRSAFIKASHANKKKHGRWFLVLFLSAIVACASYFYYVEKKALPSAAFSAFFSSISEWMTKHKSAAIQKKSAEVAIKTKTPPVTKTADAQIHFEFYDALPNVQMAAVLPNENAKMLTTASLKSPSILPIKSSRTLVANADELEREISKHIEQAKQNKLKNKK